MFNIGTSLRTTATTSAGEKTKALILQTALDLFRAGGFEVTTMRDIASAAKVATGAAYYYFPSKEAIVSAYYDEVQRLNGEKVREEWKGKLGLRERLGIAFHSKLQILRDDRPFLGALFRYTGEHGHPLSVFGKGTQLQRSQSMAIFREAMEGAGLGDEMREELAAFHRRDRLLPSPRGKWPCFANGEAAYPFRKRRAYDHVLSRIEK